MSLVKRDNAERTYANETHASVHTHAQTCIRHDIYHLSFIYDAVVQHLMRLISPLICQQKCC